VGDEVRRDVLVVGRRGEVRRRLEDCVSALAAMVEGGWFTGHEDTVGMEVELDLVDPLGRPRPVNDAVLTRMGQPDLQHELGRFNIELNLPPERLAAGGLGAFERRLTGLLRTGRIEALGVRLAAIGTLPTLGADHLTRDRLSSPSRYALLASRMRAERRRSVVVHIAGRETLRFSTDSIAPEAAATSLQLHLRVPPERFAAYYNAAQVITGAQLAVGANSPYLLGRELWQETRLPLCEQVLDTRPLRPVGGAVLPRAWLGDGWATGVVELFDSIVRGMPPLLPTLLAQEPLACLTAGTVPTLQELRLHNGTVWRWNRPVYDVHGGRPHLRIENRVLPSGPTPIDMVANAAFYFGLVRALADADRPLWSVMPFAVTGRNLHTAARLGLDAVVHWDGADVPAPRLVREVLLPLAADGLDAWGTPPVERDRYLSVVAQRVRSGQTGARWQTASVRRLEERSGLDRPAALREMTRRYVEFARTGAPVHDWPVL
jgi:gamma-glutamyl:cysteine ligase YbdK (ATP-grasp superfamily)